LLQQGAAATPPNLGNGFNPDFAFGNGKLHSIRGPQDSGLLLRCVRNPKFCSILMQRNRTPTGLFTGSFFTFAKSQRKIRVSTVFHVTAFLNQESKWQDLVSKFDF
jgi:hypothetical protein